MYAKRLTITDFKCFGRAVMDLQYPGRARLPVSKVPNINLVLGDNGGGKSSVLRAVAIAMLAPALLESGFVPYRLVRRPARGQRPVAEAILKVLGVPIKAGGRDRQGTTELTARLEAKGGRGSLDRLTQEGDPAALLTRLLDDDYSPAFFVAGYGATRRVETGGYSESSARRSRGLRYQRVAGLFEDHLALRPLENWLLPLRNERADLFDASITLLGSVLPPNVQFRGEFDRDEQQFLFDFDGVPTPFSSLSDGYKAFIGWVGDLIGHLVDVVPAGMRLDQIAGIVLVDEIDLHLHPAWQREIVPVLGAAFPRIQFILSSHSPLVASTVKRENVFVTQRAEDGTVTVGQLDEYVFGRSMEQLLLSSYFGLSTTRPEAFQERAAELFERVAGGDSSAALHYLERLTASPNPGGEEPQP